MKVFKYKIISLTWKLLILFVVIIFINNAQSAINNHTISNVDDTDNIFSIIDSVGDEYIQTQNKLTRCCVSLGGDIGVIISADGYVLTSAYDGKASTFIVNVDGEILECRRIGWQESGGIALYKIVTNRELSYAKIQSKLPSIGESVFAFGSSLNLVSDGFEFREGRIAHQHHFINTCPDSLVATINAFDGFSGGGLFNIKGELTGIITGNYKSNVYALPIIASMRFVERWLQQEGICYRGTIDGIELALNFNSFEGAKIVNIVSKSQAHKLGLRENDIITRIGDVEVKSDFDFWNTLSTYPDGWKITLTILRQAEEMNIEVSLAQGIKSKLKEYSFNPVIPTVPDISLLSSDNSESDKPSYLGISTDKNLDKKIRGIPVYHVEDGSPASAAGFIKGDIILTLNGQPMYDFAALEYFLDTHNAGSEVVFEILRGKDRISFKVILAEKK